MVRVGGVFQLRTLRATAAPPDSTKPLVSCLSCTSRRSTFDGAAGVTGSSGAVGGRALSVMAAVMAAGMAAPLACWLATRLQPSMFTAEEREQGKAAGVLGAVFISEGAIPFAAANPVRVIPSLMFGGAVAGAATMTFGVTLSAPHGGLLALFAVGHLLGFLASLALGVGAATACLVVRRDRGRATLLSSPPRVRASSTSRP